MPAIPAKTIATVLLLTLLAVGFAASLVMAIDVYLLIFLGVLCGVFFAKLAVLLGQVCPLPYKANLALIVLSAAVLSIGTIGFFGLRIEEQIKATSDSIDESADNLKEWLDEHPTVRSALAKVPLIKEFSASEPQDRSESRESESTSSEKSQDDEQVADSEQEEASDEVAKSASAGWSNIGTVNSVTGKVFGVLGKVFATTFGVAMNFAFVMFVGVFLAVKPTFYRDGLARLFPPRNRSRVTQILDNIGETLFNWLQGRAATMLITGIGTGLLLWLLGVPLAFTLGVVTGLATFVPNIGAIFALVLSMLVAASQGPPTVMWVVVVYAGLQFVESNLVTPLIQQHQTSVPPPLLLAAQLMMGVLTGFLGVLVATPLLASVMVLVKEVYIKDVLEADSSFDDSRAERDTTNRIAEPKQ